MNELLSPVRIPKTAELVAAKIRRRIITGDLQAGESLPPEAKLVKMFDISRPTIREAIRILEFEGLVSISRGAQGGPKILAPNTGNVSRAMGVALQITNASLADIYYAREIIEPAAARAAAEKRPEAAAAVLRRHVEREYAALESGDRIPTLMAEFHQRLMEESGNKTLTLVAVALRDLVAKHHALAQRSTFVDAAAEGIKRSRLGVRSHEKLVDLIAVADGLGAEAHWREHMKKARESSLGRIAQMSVVDVLEA